MLKTNDELIAEKKELEQELYLLKLDIYKDYLNNFTNIQDWVDKYNITYQEGINIIDLFIGTKID